MLDVTLLASIDLTHYLTLAAALFSLGLLTMITKRNAIGILIGVELVLNAANLNLVAFNRYQAGAGEAGRVLSAAALGMYAGSAVKDWISRRDMRWVDFQREFGCDVKTLQEMPESARRDGSASIRTQTTIPAIDRPSGSVRAVNSSYSLPGNSLMSSASTP